MKKLALSLLNLFLVLSLSAQDEWTMIHPYPTLENLYDSHFNSEQEGWIAGTDGLIIYTNNGGETWEFQHQDPDESFWAMHFVSDQEGWVVGWSEIYHTTNGGQDWNLQSHPGVMGDFTDVFFINPDTGWIVGTYQIVLKTTDGGETWVKKSNVLQGDKWYYSVHFADANNGIAVGGVFMHDGFVKITHNGGDTWIETTPGEFECFNDVEFVDSTCAWICGNNGILLKTIDAGDNWMDHSIPYNSFQDVHFFNNSNGILLGHGFANLTNNGGVSWDTTIYMGSSVSFNNFSQFGSTSGIGVGYNGAIYKASDAGYNWENMKQGVDALFSNIGFFDNFNGLAIDTYPQGDLMRTTDGGYSWHYDTIIENGPFYKFWMDGSSCFLLNKQSQIMRTYNSGEEWTLLDAPQSSKYYSDIQFIDDNVGYMCADSGVLVKTIDGGNSWTDISFVEDYYLSDMFFIDEDNGWLIDYTGKTLIHTITGGSSWTYHQIEISNYVYQPINICFVNVNKGFLTVKDGELFTTTDGGNSWFATYPPYTGSYSKLCFVSETEGWLISSSSISHTLDGGDTWINKQTFGTSSPIRSIYFLDNIKGWIGGGSGLVASYSSTVGLNELESNETSINLYPNPSSDEIVIKVADPNDRIFQIDLFDIKGLRILDLQNSISPTSWNINISMLPAGSYIARILTSQNQYTTKFIKN